MEKQAVIVFPHIPKKLIHRWRVDPVYIIFTINQLLAIGRLDHLIVKFQPWQFITNHRKNNCAEKRKNNRNINQ